MSTAPEREAWKYETLELLDDLVKAVRDDCLAYEWGSGHCTAEVTASRAAIVAHYDALRQRYAEALEALHPFVAALEEQEQAWERAREPGEVGPLPDDLRLTGRRMDSHPTVAHGRAALAVLARAASE